MRDVATFSVKSSQNFDGVNSTSPCTTGNMNDVPRLAKKEVLQKLPRIGIEALVEIFPSSTKRNLLEHFLVFDLESLVLTGEFCW